VGVHKEEKMTDKWKSSRRKGWGLLISKLRVHLFIKIYVFIIYF